MRFLFFTFIIVSFSACVSQVEHKEKDLFSSLYQGDWSQWEGIKHGRGKMIKKSLALLKKHWKIDAVKKVIINDGEGPYLATKKLWGNFEMTIEYLLSKGADSGIYVRGIPQIQIWDYTDKKQFKYGGQKGSGALWNNEPRNSPHRFPLVLADKPIGQWNKLKIRQIASRTWVWLNGKLTVNNAVYTNYFNKKKEIPKRGTIALQTHNKKEIQWRNFFVKQLP